MLDALAAGVRDSRGVAHKRDIDAVLRTLAPAFSGSVASEAGPVGDDCAAIPDGDGWLLLAMEGFQNEFVNAQPWFAGWCGVMVNVSDVCAMGGRPLAVVDALWSRGGRDGDAILAGMAHAARAYGVPIVGGHSNSRTDREQLAVAILGRAQRLITSFDARPGDVLLAAIDLRGRYREPFSNWDAATSAGSAQLRADIDILPRLAEDGLCAAGKDISMAGVIGTALMLLECSDLGGLIDVGAVPRPPGVALDRWLVSTFPSFGYLLAASAANAPAIIARFAARGIACQQAGHCDASRVLRITDGTREVPVWDLAQSPLIGCGPAAARPAVAPA